MEEGVQNSPPRVAGMDLENAVETIDTSDDEMDGATARELLEPVATDGVVTWDGVEDELAHLAKVVSTPETRTELAAIALDDAKEAAKGVPDLDIVETRLNAFEARLASIQDRVDELGTTFQGVVDPDRRDDPIIEVAEEIRYIRDTANGLQRSADELQVDLESFEEWLDDPETRVEELAEDVEIVASTVAGLNETVKGLEGGDTTVETRQDGTADAGELWKEALISHRVAGLLLHDIRTELDQLTEWHEMIDEPQPNRLADLADRVEDLEVQRASIGERLDTVATQEWVGQFRGDLDAVDSVLDGFEPPVQWDQVQSALDNVRD